MTRISIIYIKLFQFFFFQKILRISSLFQKIILTNVLVYTSFFFLARVVCNSLALLYFFPIETDNPAVAH